MTPRDRQIGNRRCHDGIHFFQRPGKLAEIFLRRRSAVRNHHNVRIHDTIIFLAVIKLLDEIDGRPQIGP